MRRRSYLLAAPSLLLWPALRAAPAASLSALPEDEVRRAVVAVLERGALAAIQKLGRIDGYFGNGQVRVPLPGAMKDVVDLLLGINQRKQLEDLQIAMNQTAEAAVVMARKVLFDAVRGVKVAEAKKILAGGEMAATLFFESRTRTMLATRLLPIVRKASEQAELAPKYERVVNLAAGLGAARREPPAFDAHITRKTLDGVYFMMGEEEKKIRRDPAGSGSAVIRKVFGALR